MNGLDLSLFQFDYDQTWAVIFFRPDAKTVLARYGTRADKDGMKHNSMQGFSDAMSRVLAIEQAWSPALQTFYEAKRGPQAKYTTADQIPSETIRKIKSREAKGDMNSCIHCHNVYDAQRDVAIAKDEYDPKAAFRYPLLSSLGLEENGTAETQPRIPSEISIANGSGDYFLRINGQNTHTLADVQFALQQVGDAQQVTIETIARSDGSEAALSGVPVRRRIVNLASDWRERGDIGWRASMYGMPPRPGLWVEAMNGSEKQARALGKDQLALKVRGVFGEDVRKSGIQTGDVIVQFGDETRHHSEGDFHAHLRLNYYRPNSELPLKLVRDGKTIDLTVNFANKQGP